MCFLATGRKTFVDDRVLARRGEETRVSDHTHDAATFKHFRALHPAWSTELVLFADGEFTGGVAQPDGRWTLTGDVLELAWYHWPPTLLRSDGAGSWFSVSDDVPLTLFEHGSAEDDAHLGGNIEGGDAATFYPGLWAWLVERFAVESVLDIGCGEGHALAEFARLGVRGVGVDGLRQNVVEARRKDVRCIHHDFTKGTAPLDDAFDLGWSCEFVEHLEERHLDNILAAFATCRVVAMTHALPGQGGHHHVNCQTSAYWIDKLASVGFSHLASETTLARTSFPDGYWRNTGLIFERFAFAY